MPTPALAKTLKDVFNTANPIPLQSGDPRYVDCTAVRGNNEAFRRLRLAPEDARRMRLPGIEQIEAIPEQVG